MPHCAGCGTGSLSIPLALQGAKVYGSDISKAMVSVTLGHLCSFPETDFLGKAPTHIQCCANARSCLLFQNEQHKILH